MNYIGITEADFGKNIYEFSEKQVADRIQSRNSEVMATGQPVITEDTLHIEGREIHFLANWFLVPGKYGMMIGGQAIDITEKKKARERTAERTGSNTEAGQPGNDPGTGA